jgi:predicted Zn-ribbon and HTH transcriptional regulator
MIKGKTWDEALARELISKNAKTFEYFSQAAQKPRFQDPVLADPAKITPSVEIPNLASWRSATRLTVLKAFDLQRQGKTSEALDELEKVLEISKKINKSQANTLELLTALDIESQILESIQKVISSSRLDNTQLKQHIQKLGEYGENRTSFISALLKSEYKDFSFYMDSFTKLRNGENVKYSLPEFSEEELEKLKNKLSGPAGKYYFQPNKTKRLVAEFAREQIKNAESICYNQNSKSEMIKNRFPNNQVSALFRENFVGETFAPLLMLQLQVAFNKKCINDIIFSTTQTLIAIKAYKNDTGNYPASLNDLVPNYLTSLPQDPFDSKPLRYSLSKKIIYSVGPDGQDSGGSSGDNLREMPDPTLQIEF